MKMMRRRTALTLSLGLLSACATPKAKIAGIQVPVMPEVNGLADSENAPAVSVPAPVAQASWPQVLGSPDHAPGNLAGPSGLAQKWGAKIGAIGGYRQPLQASPLLAQGRIFTMDADGAVAAFSADSGAAQWHSRTKPKHVTMQNLGGGIAYDSGTIYASTGYSELLSIDADSGKINWRQPLDYPARSAPTVAGGIVSVVTQNDLLLTFDPTTGTPGWRFIGKITDSTTSVAVSGAPAFDSGILVAGFASGTLAALDAASGTPLWEQSMASSYGQNSPLDFSDIVAPPVIANGVVYAIGLGNAAVAIDLHSGAKVWQRDVSGTQTIYLAGGFAYLLDLDQQLAAIHADDGLVSWIVQLPAFRNVKRKKGPQSWNGPIMVNGQLLFTSSLGTMMMVDPVTGNLGKVIKLAGPADMAPIVADGALIMLTRDAKLTSYS